MRVLQVMFLGMFIYGLWVGMPGAGLISLGMCLFVAYAERKFAAQDAAYNKAALTAAPTSVALAEHECECMRSRF